MAPSPHRHKTQGMRTPLGDLRRSSSNTGEQSKMEGSERPVQAPLASQSDSLSSEPFLRVMLIVRAFYFIETVMVPKYHPGF